MKSIKSYVKRESRISDQARLALTELWSKYGLSIQDGMIDAEKIFGRKAPLILEIGFGMGQSLFTMAQNNPDGDFIGVEVHRPGSRGAIAKSRRAER